MRLTLKSSQSERRNHMAVHCTAIFHLASHKPINLPITLVLAYLFLKEFIRLNNLRYYYYLVI